MNNYPEIMTHNIKCILCGRCEEVCRAGAIKIKDNKRYIDSELCDHCLECANVCPSKAIEVVG
ncbi:MAG: 4Fe-4S binding protein, partial [Deltaproteobacteria bacterium]|nr:4Fe-4S binding protein [Deltaproteobacteria bacterium]